MSLIVNDCVPLYKLSAGFFFFLVCFFALYVSFEQELEVSIRIWGVWVRFRLLSIGSVGTSER